MARNATKKPAKPAKTKAGKKASSKVTKRAAKATTRSRRKPEPAHATAADALVGLLESPLVAEVIAAGTAAALATLTQQALSKKSDSSTAVALKQAARAAASAMVAKLALEVEEILKSGKETRRGSK